MDWREYYLSDCTYLFIDIHSCFPTLTLCSDDWLFADVD